MAKKADFTQKLLDDLRRHKEQMTGSQTSSHSEKYRHFKHPYRESRETGSTAREMQKWLGNSTRSLDKAESSKQLVPVGRSRSTEQIADLSMALAFALKSGREAGGKYSDNSMAGYLNHIGRRSVDFGERNTRLHMDKSRTPSGRFPTLSHLHVSEISKGAQKLNQILKACYNGGLNFDIYSIEIGNELLKGAIDLEESLKMLVDLQEASEYMVSPRRKSKIKLLEVDDNDEESDVEVNKQKQIVLPRFSFDRPSMNSLECARRVTTDSVKQRLLAQSYHTGTPNRSAGQLSNSGEQIPSTSKLLSHRRSVSCGTDSSTFTSSSVTKKHPNFSNTQPEKGRIPNIIAKLMGIEELPPNKGLNNGSTREHHVKQGGTARNELKEKLQGGAKKGEQLSMDSKETVRQTARQKMVQADRRTTAPETSLVLYVNNTRPSKSPFETEVGEKKLHHKDTKYRESTDLVSKLQKSAVKNIKQEINMAHRHPNTKNLVEYQERKLRQVNLTPKKQMGKGRAEASEAVLSKVAPPTDKPPETANAKERTGINKNSFQKVERSAKNRFLMARNLEKTPHPHPSQPANVLRISKSQEAKVQENHREQQRSKNQLQMKHVKNSEMMLKHSSLSNHDSKNSHKKPPLVNHVIPSAKISTETSAATPAKIVCRHHEDLMVDENPTSVNRNIRKTPNGSLSEQCPSTRNPVDRKSMNAPLGQKVDNVYVNPRNIDDSTIDVAKPNKEQILAKLNELETYSQNATIKDNAIDVSNSLEHPTMSPDEDEVKMSSNIISVPIKGFQDDRAAGNSRSYQEEPQKTRKSETPEQLTENEEHLKQILVNSQLFLNAAEALFGLQIPVGILHSSEYNYPNEENKQVLDCGFEVMKRKGRRREFAFHPWANISVGTLRIKCLDDLVKVLYEDLEILNCFSKHDIKEHDAAKNLHEILQKDIQNCKPDVNCMWDLGWGTGMFAYLENEEVIKEVEKHVLNVLLDEFTRDILLLTTVI